MCISFVSGNSLNPNAQQPFLLLSVCDSQTLQYHFQNTKALMLYGFQQIIIYVNIWGECFKNKGKYDGFNEQAERQVVWRILTGKRREAGRLARVSKWKAGWFIMLFVWPEACEMCAGRSASTDSATSLFVVLLGCGFLPEAFELLHTLCSHGDKWS